MVVLAVCILAAQLFASDALAQTPGLQGVQDICAQAGKVRIYNGIPDIPTKCNGQTKACLAADGGGIANGGTSPLVKFQRGRCEVGIIFSGYGDPQRQLAVERALAKATDARLVALPRSRP